MNPADAAFEKNLYQEVIVEFDKQGIISDFRFALGSWQGEGMNKCGVADVERTHVMLELVERLASAYCRKDTSFLRQIFSDDALIIST